MTNTAYGKNNELSSSIEITQDIVLANDKLANAMINIIAEDGRTIIYRPEINRHLKNTEATLFLCQCIYRWKTNGKKKFYKLKMPPAKPEDHKYYREGDSWIEELEITDYSFRKAMSIVIDDLKLIIKDEDRIEHLTYWNIDIEKLTQFLKLVYSTTVPKVERQPRGKSTFTRPDGLPSTVGTVEQSTVVYTAETTTEITTETTPPEGGGVLKLDRTQITEKLLRIGFTSTECFNLLEKTKSDILADAASLTDLRLAEIDTPKRYFHSLLQNGYDSKPLERYRQVLDEETKLNDERVATEEVLKQSKIKYEEYEVLVSEAVNSWIENNPDELENFYERELDQIKNGPLMKLFFKKVSESNLSEMEILKSNPFFGAKANVIEEIKKIVKL